MAPKKASSKKTATKLVASAADAKISYNNGEKEVAEELTIDAKILLNGSAASVDVKESSKSKTTKRNVGRAKNVVPELETEVSSIKPAAKGKGKKKLNGIEVIENETTEAESENQAEPTTEINEKEVEEEIKPKGRGSGSKKAEPKMKGSNKTKDKAANAATESIQLEAEPAEEAKVPEKKLKMAGGRKNKLDVVAKTEEELQVKQEVQEEVVEEKASKKSSRNSKKADENPVEAEPPKKKGRAVKKEKPLILDEVEVTLTEEPEVKAEEKKPTKRGRGPAKAAATTAIEETPATNGDLDEVIPKKRSRKIVSIEKEILAEKPKKGRGKKAEKAVEKVTEESVVPIQGKQQKKTEITNGQAIEEKNEEIKETSGTNKKAGEPTVAAKTKGGRKRAAPSTNSKKSEKTSAEVGDQLDDGVDNIIELGEDEEDGSKTSKSKKKKTDSAPLSAAGTKYNKADFELPPLVDGQTVEEPRFNLKISSWNVAGLRAWIKKEGLQFLEYEQPDIFCLQETKCTTDQLPDEVVRMPGYHPYWLCMPGGYAGVAIYSKIMPINVEYGIGNEEFDNSGRIITAEYEKFYLINVYVPNSGKKLVNLEARMKWEKLFQDFVKKLDAHKPVVICGDMNVSHQEHDLANPKTNTRNAGFTKEERDKMSELLALGYIDTFRHLYPDRKGAYTFWTYMGNARSRNVGWRLDYFIVSERFIKRVVENSIRNQCLGSDHCPITLYLKL